MKIALLHFRAGLMDGVSLEMEKWRKVLEKRGHQVVMVAGNRNPRVDVSIKEIQFDEPINSALDKNIFDSLEDYTPSGLMNAVEERAELIRSKLKGILRNFELVIVNNVWSLGIALPVGLGLYRCAREMKARFIGHHHDFWWERERLSNPTTREIREILESVFPPDLPNVQHVVINSMAREELVKRRGLEAMVVPNVMDFDSHFPVSEELNEAIRTRVNLKMGDLVFLQATRITPRKAVELAVDVVRAFKELAKGRVGMRLYNGRTFTGRVVLAFSGMCEDEEYRKRLYKYAESQGVEAIDLYRFVAEGGSDFFEIYSVADFVTYPSIVEGWGNQLLEALIARKPLVLFEYPVFLRDIKPSGLTYVSLGSSFEKEEGLVKVDETTIGRAAEEILEILFDERRYSSIVERNFEIGREKFGFSTLEKILEDLGM